MLMDTRKKMSVFLLSSAISSLVKMREREMITPAVPGGDGGAQMDADTKESWGRGVVLTLSGHHPLRVALGQHPHVTIETGLLH